MIRKLRRKMLTTIMVFFTIILVLLFGFLIISTERKSDKEAEVILQKIVQSYRKNIKKNKKKQIVSSYDTLIITVEKGGSIQSWLSNYGLKDEVYVKAIVDKVQHRKKSFFEDQDGYYLKKKAGKTTYIAVIATAPFIKEHQRFFSILLFFFLLVWSLFLLFSIHIVRSMTQPLLYAFEQQKRFISDSGHELKTPIAVVAANVNVLKSEIGENKWLTYISDETERMKSLANHLMELLKFEEGLQFVMESFDLSRAVMGVALPFEALVYEKGIHMEYDIDPNVKLLGNEERIIKLLYEVLSNAASYCDENGLIQITLKEYKRRIELSIYNTGKGVLEEEREQIFERFYRVEKERERKYGHYGLGLAAVKAIAGQHNAKIQVTGEYGKEICFTFVFPRKRVGRKAFVLDS